MSKKPISPQRPITQYAAGKNVQRTAPQVSDYEMFGMDQYDNQPMNLAQGGQNQTGAVHKKEYKS